jgi:hypothetical protein
VISEEESLSHYSLKHYIKAVDADKSSKELTFSLEKIPESNFREKTSHFPTDS